MNADDTLRVGEHFFYLLNMGDGWFCRTCDTAGNTVEEREAHVEGVAVCDVCRKIEHSPAELADCIDSALAPPREEE